MRAILASFTYTPVQRWGPVSPHGVGTALGFFLGAWLMARRAEPRGIPKPEVYNAVTWGALGAIIGARGFYVLGHYEQFHSLKDMIAVWQGGLTMFGGFAGGLVLGLGYLRRKQFHIPTALDAAAPGFVVGVLIGRIGDIIIADHLGHPTHFFLGYKIPTAPLAPGFGPPVYVPGAVVHHTAVYDFAAALVLLGFLYVLQRKPRPTGMLFAVFAVWYGVQRFLIDFTRNREMIESFFFRLSGSQWAGLLFAFGGLVALMRLRGRAPRLPVEGIAAEVFPPAPPAVPAPEPVVTPSAPEPAVTEADVATSLPQPPPEPAPLVEPVPVPQPEEEPPSPPAPPPPDVPPPPPSPSPEPPAETD
jgi:phosphatidylglycerol:prolipoprotein diacylglycerol transferase